MFGWWFQGNEALAGRRPNKILLIFYPRRRCIYPTLPVYRAAPGSRAEGPLPDSSHRSSPRPCFESSFRTRRAVTGSMWRSPIAGGPRFDPVAHHRYRCLQLHRDNLTYQIWGVDGGKDQLANAAWREQHGENISDFILSVCFMSQELLSWPLSAPQSVLLDKTAAREYDGSSFIPCIKWFIRTTGSISTMEWYFSTLKLLR